MELPMSPGIIQILIIVIIVCAIITPVVIDIYKKNQKNKKP